MFIYNNHFSCYIYSLSLTTIYVQHYHKIQGMYQPPLGKGEKVKGREDQLNV